MDKTSEYVEIVKNTHTCDLEEVIYKSFDNIEKDFERLHITIFDNNVNDVRDSKEYRIKGFTFNLLYSPEQLYDFINEYKNRYPLIVEELKEFLIYNAFMYDTLIKINVKESLTRGDIIKIEGRDNKNIKNHKSPNSFMRIDINCPR